MKCWGQIRGYFYCVVVKGVFFLCDRCSTVKEALLTIHELRNDRRGYVNIKKCLYNIVAVDGPADLGHNKLV